jgi:probable DNA metabolism protein
MKNSLNNMFSLLENNETCDKQDELFFFSEESHNPIRCYEQIDIDFVTAYFTRGFNVSILNGSARDLFEISFNAFDIFLHSWLSELPVKLETIAFGKKVLTAAQFAHNIEGKHRIIEKIVNNRLDTNTLAVLNASAKVYHEVHRMMGFLRFSPNANGEFVARCEPDHFILPALGEYFTARFGKTTWSIIDEKRELRLRRRHGEKAKISFLNESLTAKNTPDNDEWEGLWKHYHKTINNEDRNNPNLQKQFMPKRYWKYLPEM